MAFEHPAQRMQRMGIGTCAKGVLCLNNGRMSGKRGTKKVTGMYAERGEMQNSA